MNVQANRNIIRMPKVREKTGFSRGGVYYAIWNAGFPKPIKLGERAAGWIEAEVDAWIESRASARSK